MTTLDLAALAAYGGVSGPRVAVAGTGVLALPGLIPDKGLSSPGGQSKTKSAGLAGLDSEAVRRWVAEAARTVRQIPPPVVVPSSSQQQQQQQQQQHQQQQSVQHQQHRQQHHHSIHRQRQESSPPSVAASSFVLPSSMTQTPSMHLLENNNLVEVAMVQQQQQSQQQMQMQPQKQKQTSPTNNNTIEAWRSIQGGHQWWSPPSTVHQEQQQQQQVSPLGQQVPQSQSLVAGTVCGQVQRQSQIQSEIDQPLDFSVGSLQQQRLHSRVRTIHERLQSRMHDNNNGTAGSGQKIVRGTGSRRSFSPSDGSSSSSEDEGVSTGGSPSGPLRGTENGESSRHANSLHLSHCTARFCRNSAMELWWRARVTINQGDATNYNIASDSRWGNKPRW